MKELKDRITNKNNSELKDEAEKICGKPDKPHFYDEIVAVIKWEDGTVIDTVRKIKY